MKEKSHHINIYKLKNIDDITGLSLPECSPPFGLEKEGKENNLQYKLFIQRNFSHPPAWRSLLDRLIDKSKPAILSSSSSFVLFVRHEKNFYALTGGFGHTKIKDLVDDEFGLYMALRLIGPDDITGITQKSMKGSTRQIYRVVVGYRPDLDLENYTRFLRAMEGKPIDKRLGVHISGRASLSFMTKIQFSDFERLFVTIEEIYNSEPLTEFPKSYEIITNENEIGTLNSMMLQELNRYLKTGEDGDRLYLELKDIFDQFKCNKFYLSVGRRHAELPYFNIESIRDQLRHLDIVNIGDIEELRKIELYGLDDNDHVVFEDESLVKILVCELDYRNSSYIYLNKKWYKIYEDFKKHVDSEISIIEKAVGLMPDWDNTVLPGKKDEKEYNIYAGKLKKWAVLDRDFIKMKDSTNIEVCDLYDKDNQLFIHVKKAWGSKTSYLFAQGLVSGILNYQSIEFRKACQKKWPPLFAGTYVRGARVVFAIADNKALDKNFPDNLTFFSKINLMQTVSDLNNYGYIVVLAPTKVIN